MLPFNWPSSLPNTVVFVSSGHDRGTTANLPVTNDLTSNVLLLVISAKSSRINGFTTTAGYLRACVLHIYTTLRTSYQNYE